MTEIVAVIRCNMAAYGHHLTRILAAVAGVLNAGCAPKPEGPAQAPGADSANGPVEIVTDRTFYRAGITARSAPLTVQP